MKRTLNWVLGLLLTTFVATAQESNVYFNSAEKMLATDGKLMIGGYGTVDYTQELNPDFKKTSSLDVSRIVLLFGYKFNDRTQFISEVEFEHVSELYVEQAFLQYKLNKAINFQGGLLLVPMGIVNQYHEPTTFNGVKRPFIDGVIAPTTWREIGAGISGNLTNQSLKYQAYVMNGFNGYTAKGGATFSGDKGLRNGRQKGANSYMSSPNFTGRVEYYGLKGLNMGVSGYFGQSQSDLYNGVAKDPETTAENNAIANADSSTIGISMVGFDTRYTISALQLRGQVYLTSLDNTNEYNKFTKPATKTGYIGSKMFGYYVEAGYNVMKHFDQSKSELTPFVRYEDWDTQSEIATGFAKNPAYNKNAITAGLGWKPAPGAVVKADMQWVNSEASTKATKYINVGIGVMF